MDRVNDPRTIIYLVNGLRIYLGYPDLDLLEKTKELDCISEIIGDKDWFDFIGALHDENNLRLGHLPYESKRILQSITEKRLGIIRKMLEKKGLFNLHQRDWSLLEKNLNRLDSFVSLSAKDFSLNEGYAWFYGIICGWDSESYEELREEYGWNNENIELNKAIYDRLHSRRMV